MSSCCIGGVNDDFLPAGVGGSVVRLSRPASASRLARPPSGRPTRSGLVTPTFATERSPRSFAPVFDLADAPSPARQRSTAQLAEDEVEGHPARDLSPTRSDNSFDDNWDALGDAVIQPDEGWRPSTAASLAGSSPDAPASGAAWQANNVTGMSPPPSPPERPASMAAAPTVAGTAAHKVVDTISKNTSKKATRPRQRLHTYTALFAPNSRQILRAFSTKLKVGVVRRWRSSAASGITVRKQAKPSRRLYTWVGAAWAINLGLVIISCILSTTLSSMLTPSEIRLCLISWFFSMFTYIFLLEPFWVLVVATWVHNNYQAKLENLIANLRVRSLIARGGKTGLDKALREAAANGDLPYLVRLIAHGATDLDGALRAAAETGQFAMVEFLVDKGASASDLNTALLNASSCGHVEIVKHLVTHGATATGTLETALQMAAGHGHMEVVEWLISQGASGLQLALEAARQYEQEEVADWLYARIAEQIAHAYFGGSE